jgi:hypothetical protein
LPASCRIPSRFFLIPCGLFKDFSVYIFFQLGISHTFAFPKNGVVLYADNGVRGDIEGDSRMRTD